MADDRGHQDNTPVTPDEVAHHEFATTFRGYDPGEVRSFLERVSGRLRALEDLSRGLRGRVASMQAELERRAKADRAADAGAPPSGATAPVVAAAAAAPAAVDE